MGGDGRGQRGDHGDGKRLDFAWSMMQCADDVLLTCALKTYMVLLSNVISVNSMKNITIFSFL